MGTNASTSKVRRPSSIRPKSTIDPLKRQPSQPTAVLILENAQCQPKKKQPPPELIWPLPPDEKLGSFHADWAEQRDAFGKLFQEKVQRILADLKKSAKTITKMVNKTEIHQKESDNTRWNSTNSCIHDSAHVQSNLKTESHSCHNLSTSEETEKLKQILKEVHVTVDERIKRRLQAISEETAELIQQINDDKHNVQQQLLLYSKTVQARQDELYRVWLQKYVAVLDDWRSGKLAELQIVLEKEQDYINEAARKRTENIIHKSNDLKLNILKQEQDTALEEINKLMTQISSLSSRETLQHLGSETITKINLTVHANVGRKLQGQQCTFNMDLDDKPQ